MSEVAQSVKDALADAETLRRVYRSVFRGARYKLTDVAMAEHFGENSTTAPQVGSWGPFSRARAAARAAFRAVPGLRGE